MKLDQFKKTKTVKTWHLNADCCDAKNISKSRSLSVD